MSKLLSGTVTMWIITSLVDVRRHCEIKIAGQPHDDSLKDPKLMSGSKSSKTFNNVIIYVISKLL